MLLNNKGDSTLVISKIWHIMSIYIHRITFELYNQNDLACDSANV